MYFCSNAQITITNNTGCAAVAVIFAHDATYSTSCALRTYAIGIPAGGSFSRNDIAHVNSSGPGWDSLPGYTGNGAWDWDGVWITFSPTATPSISVGQTSGCIPITSGMVGSPCGPVNVTWTYNGTGNVDVLLQ